MPYNVRRITQPDGSEVAELVRDNGTVAFSVDPTIDPELFGHLCTPRWLDAINAGDGAINEQARTVSITSLGKQWTARTEEQRDELIALRDQFAGELATGLGITAGRAQFFVGWLWRVLKAALPLLRATGRF